MSKNIEVNLIERATEILSSLTYVNIATSNPSAEPWNTPVFAPWDKNLNFYWSSWRDAEHSKNIRVNPRVFLTLYDSTRVRGTNNLRCLYLQATAHEVNDEGEVSIALPLVYPGEAVDKQNFLGASVKRIYKAVPTSAWLNDRSEREVDPSTVKMRIELNLEKLTDHCRQSTR